MLAQYSTLYLLLNCLTVDLGTQVKQLQSNLVLATVSVHRLEAEVRQEQAKAQALQPQLDAATVRAHGADKHSTAAEVR